ncbi:MAG TPA: hypothetical protein VK573_07480 [Gemmatimonadales bacterium]|nr:hypothetical protein [Gemmatimonadales bacterium]
MAGLLTRVVRQVALALSDSAMRTVAYGQLQRSPYREHKLHFRTLVNAEPRLLRAIAAAGNTSQDGVLALLDSVIDLEFYMPVPGHWAAWKGDSRLLVAGALDDHDVPVGFNLAGRPVALSAVDPPEVPALVLVPVETDFSTRLQRAREAAGAAASPTVEPPGVYMTSSVISDHAQYEGWTAGATEFEVHAFVQNDVGTFVDVQCAGADQSAPLYYDQNSDSWSGRVLLILESGIGLHQVEFQVWEDDTGACTWNGGRPPHTTGPTRQNYQNFASRIVEVILGESKNRVKNILLAVPALLDIVTAVNYDDPVGVLNIQPTCWNPIDPDRTPIKISSPDRGGASVGSVRLDITFGEQEPLCPLLTNVAIFGWSEVYPDQEYTWSTNIYGGAGPFGFQWGGPLSGNWPEITGSLSSSGTLYVTVWSGDGQGPLYAECSITVTDSPDPYLCPDPGP